MYKMRPASTKNTKTIPLFLSILMFILVIGTGVVVYFIEDYSPIFLGAYGLIGLFVICCNRKIPTGLGGLFRTLVGALFIFSGFVKCVDPRGFDYKIIDYLEAYNIMWLEPLSMALAMAAIAAEFIIGCMMFFDVKHKIAVPIATLMMIGFTILTFIDATKNMVPDCGCFGEAVKMSNWQTFYKNLTLDLCLLIVWFAYRRIKPIFYPGAEVGLVVLFGIVVMAIQIYSVVFLPIIDFRDWKEGKSMKLENPLPIEYWVDYKNDKTGETTSMRVEDIPYTDSVWMSQWHFVQQRTIDKNVYPHNVMLFDENGTNVTTDVFEYAEPHIVIVSYLLDEMKMRNFEQLQNVISYCDENGIMVEFITASEYDYITHFADSLAIDAPFYNADDIELKAMIRSNPGVIAMKDGVVLKKWSHNNLPEVVDLEEILK